MYVLNELSAAVNYVRWRIKLVYLPNNCKRCKLIFVRCILFCAIYYSFVLSYNIHFNVDFAFDESFLGDLKDVCRAPKNVSNIL